MDQGAGLCTDILRGSGPNQKKMLIQISQLLGCVRSHTAQSSELQRHLASLGSDPGIGGNLS